MFNTTDAVPRGDGALSKLQRKLKGRKPVKRNGISQLSAVLSDLVELASMDIYRKYLAPEDPESKLPLTGGLYSKTESGRAVGKAVAERLPPERILESGSKQRFRRKKKTGAGGITSEEFEPMKTRLKGKPAFKEHYVYAGTEERVRTDPETRRVVSTPEQLQALKKQMGPRLKVQTMKYPAYTTGHGRADTEAYVRAKYDIAPSEPFHTATGTIIPRLSRLHKEKISQARAGWVQSGYSDIEISKRAKQMSEGFIKDYKSDLSQVYRGEAGIGRARAKEADKFVRQTLKTEMGRHRAHAAGELRGLHEIVQSRRRHLGHFVKAPKAGVMDYYRTILEGDPQKGVKGLIDKHQEHYDKLLSHHESRIHQTLTKGIATEDPSLPHAEAARQAEEWQALISHRNFSPPARPLNEGEYGKLSHYMTLGSGRPVTTKHIDAYKQGVDRLRDLATGAGRGEIRKKILAGGELWKGDPFQPIKRFPAGKVAIGVAGGAALLGGALYAAHRIRKRREQRQPVNMKSKLGEIQFALKVKVPWSVVKGAKERAVRRAVNKLARAGRLKDVGALPSEKLRIGLQNLKEAEKNYAIRERQQDKLQEVLEDQRIRLGRIPARKAEKLKAEGYAQGAAEERGAFAGSVKKIEGQHAAAMTEEKLRHGRTLGWAIGGTAAAAGAAGGGVGYALGRRKSQERQFSALDKIRSLYQADPKTGEASPAHDITIGAVEGGLAYPASDYLIKKFAPKGSGLARKIAVGGAVGGVATGLVGIGLSNIIKGKKKLKKEQFSSRARLIRFAKKDNQNPPLPSRTLVARDRYIKGIHQRELEHARTYYGHSALAGAALGLALRGKMPLHKAAALGAIGGIGTQAVARQAAEKTKDPFGEESWTGKRIERAPYIAGGLAAAAVTGAKLHKAYKKLPIKFRSRFRLIQFQDDPEEQYREWAHSVLMKKKKAELKVPGFGRPRAVKPFVADAKKWGRRIESLRYDWELKRKKIPNVDARGRERTPEWKKPWVAGLATSAAVGGGYLAWRGFPRHGVPGLRNIVLKHPLAQRLGGEWFGIKKEAKDTLAGKSTGPLEKLAEKAKEFPGQNILDFKKAGKVDIKKQATLVKERGEITAQRKLEQVAAPQKKPAEIFKFPGGKRVPNPPKNLSARLREIRFQSPDWGISHRSTRTAVVYAPGGQARQRRQKEWWEKKKNQEKLWTAGVVGAGTLAAGGASLIWHKKLQKLLPKRFHPKIEPVEGMDIVRPAHPGFQSKLQEVRFQDRDYAAPVGVATGAGGFLAGGLYRGRKLKPGENLTGRRVTRPHSAFPLLQHEGVGISGGRIVHVEHLPEMGKEGTVQSVTPEQFAKGSAIKVLDRKISKRGAERAQAAVGKTVPYSLLYNNCQRFGGCVRKGRTRFVPRQLRTALITSGIATAGGIGATKVIQSVARSNKKVEFAASDDDKRQTARKVGKIGATVGGLGAAGLGLSLMPVARAFGKIQIGKMRGIHLGPRFKSPAIDPNLGGKMVFNYIHGAQTALNTGVRGHLIGKALREAKFNPQGLPGKMVNQLPQFRGKAPADRIYSLNHYQRFRSSYSGALDHWEYEHKEYLDRMRSTALKRPNNPKSERMFDDASRRFDIVETGRKHFNEEMHHHTSTLGKNEKEAFEHVASRTSNPAIHAYFDEISKTKQVLAKQYAVGTGLAAIGLTAGGLTTAGLANREHIQKHIQERFSPPSQKRRQVKRMSAKGRELRFARGDYFYHRLHPDVIQRYTGERFGKTPARGSPLASGWARLLKSIRTPLPPGTQVLHKRLLTGQPYLAHAL